MQQRIAQAVEGYDDQSVDPTVWRYARARRVRVIVDGEDYFAIVQQAMLKARQRILLIGWDFDTRIHLTQGRRWFQKGTSSNYPSRLGSFIVWLSRHRPGLEIRILKWSFGIFSMLTRGAMLLDFLRWAWHRRIDFKFDSRHPVGCSHHQKIVVIDSNLAVCGGIDMTSRRWDTREHLEHDPRRKQPGGSLYAPWHDVTMIMEGDIATALDALGRARWVRAGGKPLAVFTPGQESAWPDGVEPHFEDVEIGVARTRAAYDGDRKVDEIENLFIAQIAAAKNFIYMENQYFASRAIAEAIAQRLAEPDPPEIVIVHAAGADGWIEGRVMDPARAELVRVLDELDRNDRFHLYVPYSGETAIYVHAKLTIVDDCILRIGSANLNNRSMGLDSECDVFIDCARPGNDHAGEGIKRLRLSLLAEHLGLAEDEVPDLLERAGSMAGLIAWAGTRNARHLRPFHPADEGELATDIAARQMLDPERPEELLSPEQHKSGLFRPGSLLARARARLRRKNRKTHTPDE